jgi:periplasmic protein TonB
MFEQAVLHERPLTGRCLAIVVATSGEVVLVLCLLIAPVIWPQVLSRAQFMTWLTVPAPAVAPKSLPIVHVRPALKPLQLPSLVLVAPSELPAKVLITEDPPPPLPEFESGVTGMGGPDDLSRLTLGVLNQAVRPPQLSPAEAPIAPPAASRPDKPRIRVGGEVQMARLRNRVEPVYPVLAKQARISGTVELTGIIGTDGRIRELRVLRGHPLLAKAALDAVQQWIYEATLLNGEPVEVIAPITITFRLN